MATSAISICNLALVDLGQSDTIESFQERSSLARRLANTYDPTRREVLEGHDWPFARRRQLLALHAEDPPAAWVFRYQVPANMIAARFVVNPMGTDADAVPYELELGPDGASLTLLTNLQDAELRYTADVTNPSIFTPLFSRTLAKAIAARLALSVTGKIAVKNAVGNDMVDSFTAATSSAANQGQKPPPPDADWISGRY